LPNALNSFSSEIEKAINRAIFDVMTDETTYQLLRTVFWAAIQSENPVYIKHVQENSKESEMLLDVGSNRKIEFNKPFLIEDTNSELDFDSNKDRADKGKKHKTKKTPNKVLIG
jgi:hypothetical protein